MSRIVRADGFSLIELAVVVVLIGLVLGIGVPSYLKATAGSRVGAAADGIVGRIHLAHQRAVTERRTLELTFLSGATAAVYLNDDHGLMLDRWSLPRGISFGPGTEKKLSVTPDGRFSKDALVIVRDDSNLKDTVSVQRSGLVLSR